MRGRTKRWFSRLHGYSRNLERAELSWQIRQTGVRLTVQRLHGLVRQPSADIPSMVLSEHGRGVIARRESFAFEKVAEVGSLDHPTYGDLACIDAAVGNDRLRDVRRDVRTVIGYALACW